MFFGFWDPTMLLILPALALAIYAQFKVRSTHERMSQVQSASGRVLAGTTTRGSVWLDLASGAESPAMVVSSKAVWCNDGLAGALQLRVTP